MRSEIDVIQRYGVQVLLYGVEVRGGDILLSPWNQIEKKFKYYVTLKSGS